MFLVLRYALTLGLLFMVWHESGPWTVAALSMLFLWTEMLAVTTVAPLIRKDKERRLDA